MINKAKTGKCAPYNRLGPVSLRRGRRIGSRDSTICCNGRVKGRFDRRETINKNLGANDIKKFRGIVAYNW